MKSARRIIVTVSPEGTVNIQTRGYTGPACVNASRWMEQALGVTTDDKKTPDYHQRETGSNPTSTSA